MQEGRTRDLLPNTPPPIPSHEVERKVWVKAVPTSSSLRYVFNVVMGGDRGSIGWDSAGDLLILYLQVEEIDHLHFPDLSVGSEVWAVFQNREDISTS